MKIGPLDIGIKTLALAAAVVVVIMLDIRFLVANHSKRIEGFYSSRIPSYLVAGTQRDMADGVTQCGYLLRVIPRHVSGRMYKATLHLNLSEYDKAEELFRAVAEDSAAPDEFRAMAAHSMGASVFARSPEPQRPKAALEAGRWFMKALERDPDLADAKVAICIAVEWLLYPLEKKADSSEGKAAEGKAAEGKAAEGKAAEGKAAEGKAAEDKAAEGKAAEGKAAEDLTAEDQAALKQAQVWLAAALREEPGKNALTRQSVILKQLELLESVKSSKRPPSLEGTAQYYNVYGLILTRANKLLEAEQAFDTALALRPRWKMPELNQFRAMVRLLPETNVKLKIREDLLDKYSGKITRHAEDSLAALNAFAVAWFRTREVARSEDYEKLGYPKALGLLQQAYDRQGDASSMLSAVAIMDDRLFAEEGVLATISKDFLMPCPVGEAASRWQGDAPTRDPSRKKPEDLRKAFFPVYKVATAMKALLRDCTKKVRLSADLAAEVKLRLLACDMLVALGTQADDQQALHTALPQRAQEIKGQHSDNPDALIAYAHFMLRTENYTEAGRALRSAFELGAQSEEMKKIVDTISAKPQLIQPRPDARGWFGQRPLARATLWAPNSPGQMTAGTMSFNDQNVTARIVGSQIIYMIPEGRVTDGNHKVKVEAVDGYGNKAELEYSFGVDKVGPKMTITPGDGGEVKGPRPVWTIGLSDGEGTGVDVNSVQVRLSNAGAGATPCRALLVDGGAYQADMPGAQAKRGDRVAETFKVESIVNLTPGAYQLSVSFADKAGNQKEQSLTYNVK